MITIVQSTACCVTGIRDIKPCALGYLLACPEPWPSRRQSASRWVITPVTRFRTSDVERGGGCPSLANTSSQKFLLLLTRHLLAAISSSVRGQAKNSAFL